MAPTFEDKMNERIGPHRFEGPKETVDACLFRSKIFVRHGEGEVVERACSDLDKARSEWRKLTNKLISTGHREVPSPEEPRARTLVLERDGESISYRIEGSSIFEERKPAFFPVPAPMYRLFSHAHAVALVEQLAKNFESSGYVRSEVPAKPSGTRSQAKRAPAVPVAGEPQVRIVRSRGRPLTAVIDLADDAGEWSSLAELMSAWCRQRDARDVRALVLRADASIDEHSLTEALEAVVSSPLAKKLEELRLDPADSEGRALPLGDLSNVWKGLPALEALTLDCSSAGATVLGQLRLPRLERLDVILSQGSHVRALEKLEAPRLRSVRVEFLEAKAADARALWTWLGSLQLEELELEGGFVPKLITWLDASPWTTKLTRLELIANDGAGVRQPLLTRTKKKTKKRKTKVTGGKRRA